MLTKVGEKLVGLREKELNQVLEQIELDELNELSKLTFGDSHKPYKTLKEGLGHEYDDFELPKSDKALANRGIYKSFKGSKKYKITPWIKKKYLR